MGARQRRHAHDSQVAALRAEGVGLCRTEHMLFGDERLAAMSE